MAVAIASAKIDRINHWVLIEYVFAGIIKSIKFGLALVLAIAITGICKSRASFTTLCSRTGSVTTIAFGKPLISLIPPINFSNFVTCLEISRRCFLDLLTYLVYWLHYLLYDN